MPFLVAFFKSGVAFFKVCKLRWRFSKFAKIAVAFFKVWKLQWHFYESPYLLWHLSNLFFETEAGCQLGCAGHSGMSRQPSLLCLPQTSPVVFLFFLKMASPVFLENTKTEAYLLLSAPLGCKSFLGGMH